jgi:hypothetical protein
MSLRNSIITPPPPPAEAPTSESHPEYLPEHDVIVPAANPSRDEHQMPPSSSAAAAAAVESQIDRDIPQDVTFGVSMATCSTISAPSRATAEPW